jgi:hypothetical protein
VKGHVAISRVCSSIGLCIRPSACPLTRPTACSVQLAAAEKAAEGAKLKEAAWKATLVEAVKAARELRELSREEVARIQVGIQCRGVSNASILVAVDCCPERRLASMREMMVI